MRAETGRSLTLYLEKRKESPFLHFVIIIQHLLIFDLKANHLVALLVDSKTDINSPTESGMTESEARHMTGNGERPLPPRHFQVGDPLHFSPWV